MPRSANFGGGTHRAEIRTLPLAEAPVLSARRSYDPWFAVHYLQRLHPSGAAASADRVRWILK